MHPQLLDRNTESSSYVAALPGAKKQNNFVAHRVASGIVIVALSAAMTSNMSYQNNSMTQNRQIVIKTHKDEYASTQYPNNVFDLGAYSGENKMMGFNSEENQIDFEYAIHAMEKLENINVLPTKEVKTYKIASIKKSQGKIIAPDEDDFFYAIDSDTL